MSGQYVYSLPRSTATTQIATRDPPVRPVHPTAPTPLTRTQPDLCMSMGDVADYPAATAALFQPIRVGEITLGHRVVFAPLTRCRTNSRGVHTDIGVEHYAQRASVPGSLLISEATYVSRVAEGRSANAPGVWNEEQIAAWKKVRNHDGVWYRHACRLTNWDRSRMPCMRRVRTYSCRSGH